MGDALPRLLGRYALFDEIAAGGMATVHLGRLLGPVGFGRTVAIKRLHPQYARDQEFVAMFLDEARLAARIQHPNVVQTIDVVQTDDELFLVMEYVRGESLAWVRRALVDSSDKVPPEVAVAVMTGALYGLHHAHEATTEAGDKLGLVHRDISPQNILVGEDGTPRVLDFGVAKATARLTSTRGGNVKGKLGYMAPEQLRGTVDRRTDVYAAGLVTWELLTGRRAFQAENDGQLVLMVTEGCTVPPSTFAPGVSRELDDAVMSALTLDPDARCPTARELAIRLERALRPATAREVGEYLASIAGPRLEKRARRVAEIERASVDALPAPAPASSPASVDEPSSPTRLTSSASSPRPPARGALWAIVGVSAILIVGGLLALLLTGPRRAPAGPVAEVPSPRAAASPTLPPASAAPAMSTAAPSASQAPTAPPSAAPSPIPAPHAGHAPAATTATTRPAARPAKGSCDPPYTLDSSGVKRYKPECL